MKMFRTHITLMALVSQVSFYSADPDSTALTHTEKVYIQTDRQIYSPGEDIWFRAYLVDGDIGILSGTSRKLYVELISPYNTVAEQRIIRLEAGMGSGDFQLKESIDSGTYRIRAYTNWMRNFGKSFFYHKKLTIINPAGHSPETGLTRTIDEGSQGKQDQGTSGEMPGIQHLPEERSSDRRNQDGPRAGFDLQFFPEGGSLVTGVSTKIAFKAVDPAGNPCPVEGMVLDREGDTVAFFKSSHQGMGFFYFLPRRGQEYSIMASSGDGISYEFRFPAMHDTGYILTVRDWNKDELLVGINTNRQTLTEKGSGTLFLEGQFGSSVIMMRINKVQASNSLRLLKSNLPPGLVILSLYDSLMKPFCQRLIYNNNAEGTLLTVTPDKQAYNPREKTSLQLSISDGNSEAVRGNISLSAVKTEAVQVNENEAANICSYFMLESNLQGFIENPGYYFNRDNPDRHEKLDLLLLTQGWRDYKWKYIHDTTNRIEYPAEQGFNVGGRLTTIIRNRPIMNATITMMFLNEEDIILRLGTTDSLGRYFFPDLDMRGAGRIILNATGEKGRNRGLLKLDSLQGNQEPVEPLPMQQPVVDSTALAYREEELIRENILKQYRLSDTIPIKEVTITKERETDPLDDGHYRIYGTPDAVITVTDKESGYFDVFELMRGRIAGVMVRGHYPNYQVQIRGASSLTGSSQPLFVLDGMPVDMEMIASLPVAVVDKIEVLKTAGNTAVYGSRGANGVISILTKKGGNVTAGPPPAWFINRSISGFYRERVFYAPKYDRSRVEENRPDLRTTIHWDPHIRIDEDGIARVEYYNSDQSTTIIITVEGITDNGIPVYSRISYKVD